MITAKELYIKQRQILALAKASGFKDIRIRPPIISAPLREPFDELYLIVSVKHGASKSASQLTFESKLETLLRVDVHVETNQDVNTALNDKDLEERYRKLKSAAILLRSLKKGVPLETQWVDALRKDYSAVSVSMDTDLNEFFLVDSSKEEKGKRKQPSTSSTSSSTTNILKKCKTKATTISSKPSSRLSSSSTLHVLFKESTSQEDTSQNSPSIPPSSESSTQSTLSSISSI